MSPELELLDVLEGSDLPLPDVLSLLYSFPDEASAARAISRMARDGKVLVLNDRHEPLAEWELDALFRCSGWSDRKDLRISLKI